MFRKVRHIHFVGIGGAGMSGIAEVLLNLGYRVSGSDLQDSERIQRLRSLGGIITLGHRASNIQGAQVVVVSSAVAPDNVEVVAARRAQIPVIPRAEMLGELMRLKESIAVSGAHGKTTTTSLIATVLAGAGMDPTVVIGGKLNQLGSHARLGQGNLLVAEVDESDGSFRRLFPTLAVVTNLDQEHLDHYGSMEALQEAFLEFIHRIPFYGLVILCVDDPGVQALLPRVEKRVLTYGMHPEADVRAQGISLGKGVRFRASFRGKDLGEFSLPLPGLHNVQNALAALGVALELEIPMEQVAAALAHFRGVERRFQILGSPGDILVVDDYAHHPTEIRATLEAARSGWGRRQIVVFQPHRYTRTRDLLSLFPQAFERVDYLVLTPIYGAGERPIPGVTAQRLLEAIRQKGGPPTRLVGDLGEAVAAVREVARPGDMVLTLGAGDVWKVARTLCGGPL